MGCAFNSCQYAAKGLTSFQTQTTDNIGLFLDAKKRSYFVSIMAIDYLETTVVDMFGVWARTTPEATAVEWNGSRLTFAGLRNASLHVSKALLSVGAGPGDKIPILSQMSIELIPAILGVLRVGACYVPIDMEVWSKTRIDATLEDISPQVAVATDRSDTRRVPVIVFFQQKWLHLAFDDASGTLSQLDTIRQNLNSKTLVYVTFTSGTTGKPKGVMIYHKALSLFAALKTNNTNNTEPGERVLLGSCISFDGKFHLMPDPYKSC
jgi:non-ribosomal peptide synthetase component F